MNEQQYNVSSIFQLKRAKSEVWEQLNPILASGEPGFDIDACGIKVGDGKTHWKDLKFIGDTSVINRPTHYDFPSIGNAHTIYKAEKEKIIYQWNSETLSYEQINQGSEILDITLIHGGNANGTNS